MMTRRVVEALLFAALVPVGVVGVQTWRDAGGEPAPRVVASAIQTRRPQLGHTTPRRPGEAAFSATPKPESPRVEPHDAVPSDVPMTQGRPHASINAVERQHIGPLAFARRDGPRPSSESAPQRGGSGGLPAGSSALAAMTSAGGAFAASSLVAVDFVGVMQDLTLLKRNDFVADLVRQLKIIVYWKVAGKHAQRLELFTPDGGLYRRIATDFTGTGVTAPGTPVETQLPVGGSWITEHSLFGAWRVDVYLDGQPATTASFVLNR
jgi:hypothetical protein